MRILLTNHHLKQLGGTETWVLTLARELAKTHEVGVYTNVKGYVSNLLGDLMDDHPQDYDLALVNHNSCADVARKAAKYTIFTSHGIYPRWEIPAARMDYYVAVNGSVSRKYQIPHIIKNPIDTELFKPASTIGTSPERILALTSVRPPFRTLQLTRNNYNSPQIMNQADVVISLGRGAFEAMSCGRAVIIWDNRDYLPGPSGYGYIDDLSVLDTADTSDRLMPNIDWQQELAKYRQEHGEANRDFILREHAVSLIADQYLNIFSRA